MKQTKQRLEHIRDYVLQTFPRTKIADLPYHNLFHTLDVVNTTQQLAQDEGVNESELEYLVAAAYLHDVGHIFQSKRHEKIGAKYIRSILRGFGYNNKEEKYISQLVEATELSHTPTTLSEKILRDADIRNLGDNDFWQANEAVRQELDFPQTKFWYNWSLVFMQNVQYHTKTAQKRYNAKLMQNIVEVQNLLEVLK